MSINMIKYIKNFITNNDLESLGPTIAFSGLTKFMAGIVCYRLQFDIFEDQKHLFLEIRVYNYNNGYFVEGFIFRWYNTIKQFLDVIKKYNNISNNGNTYYLSYGCDCKYIKQQESELLRDILNGLIDKNFLSKYYLK